MVDRRRTRVAAAGPAPFGQPGRLFCQIARRVLASGAPAVKFGGGLAAPFPRPHRSPVTPREAAELFEYNDWANARLLACAAQLPAGAWSEDLGGAFPTMLSLVAHVVGAERVWLMRWKEETPKGRPAWMSAPDPSVLRSVLDEVERDRTGFLRSVSAEDLARPISYTLLDGSGATLPLATLVRHTANHSTYHRGQLASMLRRLGAAPPATDLLVFAVERSERDG